MKVLLAATVLSLFSFSSTSFAADFFCSSNAGNPQFEVPVKVTGKEAQMNGRVFKVIYVRKTHANNGTELSLVRISDGDWAWAMLCADGVQKKIIDRQRGRSGF